LRGLVIAALVASALSAAATEPASSNAPPGEVLLTDSLGRAVHVPTNELPRELLPPGGLSRQIPVPTRGAQMPEAVQQRVQQSRESAGELQWFPATQPRMMPYLASNDEYGNTAIRPGALIPFTPLDQFPQQAKYWLSEIGLRYSLKQTATFVSMSDVMQGADTLGFYTFDFAGKWAVIDSVGTAGWITFQVEEQSGLGAAGTFQDAGSNLGTTADPTGFYSSHNGWRIPELGWQQSLCDGELVIVAGMISQGNYFDANSYANDGRGQFMNAALIDTMVMPLPHFNFAANIQWQPVNEWYAMVGSSVGNASDGETPWTDLSSKDWTVLGETGYAPDNFLGMGPGIYRVQPFLAASGGWTQGGLGLNFQQQLGKQSPLGWFGRYGFGGAHVANGAKEQIGTGFAWRGPFEHLLVGRQSNDYLGVGFVWSQPAATTKPVIHENECVLETTYAMQLTPTTKLQPDLQVLWNPTFNPAASAVVFQLQLDLAW